MARSWLLAGDVAAYPLAKRGASYRLLGFQHAISGHGPSACQRLARRGAARGLHRQDRKSTALALLVYLGTISCVSGQEPFRQHPAFAR